MRQIVPQDASQLALAIREGKCSAVEVLETFLNRIHLRNPALNAIVTLDIESARQQAREADQARQKGEVWGPLHGVPVTLKDAFETAGLRTTSGSARLAHHIPRQDAPVVASLRRAGAIILGKTNLPPLADGAQTDNTIFGRTNNPWNQHCTPGGSSGGGAAAVAAGLSPLDIGSDLDGSLRLPAHFCGIYALKPTGARVSVLGHIVSTRPPQLPTEWLWMQEMTCAGPLARSVADLRLCLEVIAQPGTPPLLPPPPRSLNTLRIAWTDEMGGIPLTKGSQHAIQSVTDTLARAGCLVEHCQPAGFSYEDAWELSGKLVSYLNTLFKPRLTRLTRRFFSIFSNNATHAHPVMRGFMKGPGLNAGQIEQLRRQRQAVIQQVEAFLSTWDAWICPVFPRPAYFHRPRNAPIEVDRQEISQDLAKVMPNVIFNLTGHPVVVIPTGHKEDELPIGVQLIGRRWGEMELLEVAQQVSQLTGSFRYPPGYQ